MYDPVKRENEILEIVKEFADKKLDFVVVGGYAVSAFRHRFSVDADIVIKKEDKEKFKKHLDGNGYKKTISKQLKNIYSSEFERYENEELKVSIDLLLGGIGIRQTGTALSFEFLNNNAEEKLIEGLEKAVKAKIPRKEVLIILKLHSGRLTDFRDVAALCFSLDMDFIRKHIFIGDQKVLKQHMKKLGTLVGEKGFQDSFKGVFQEKKYKLHPEEIKRLVELKK